MKDSIYHDVKSGYSRLKRDAVVAIFAIACAALILIVLSSFKATETTEISNGNPMLREAIAQTKGKSPTIFSRKDIITDSRISAWVFDDTDHHVLINKNDKYALFTQTLVDNTLELKHVTGDACQIVTVEIIDNKIDSIECDWAKFNRIN
ncbi:hypothetical protein [Serratia marcescens]|uniref:hypothetical protein n=1 Tax=Serratia marcescens TaxID=615 RepID=UPI001495AB5D|nr:hypothetical protein [Serratia marcescens]